LLRKGVQGALAEKLEALEPADETEPVIETRVSLARLDSLGETPDDRGRRLGLGAWITRTGHTGRKLAAS